VEASESTLREFGPLTSRAWIRSRPLPASVGIRKPPDQRSPGGNVSIQLSLIDRFEGFIRGAVIVEPTQTFLVGVGRFVFLVRSEMRKRRVPRTLSGRIGKLKAALSL
jgi:hypothetical protein